MDIGLLLFVVIDIVVIATYCVYYKPKNFYGGYPASLWRDDFYPKQKCHD